VEWSPFDPVTLATEYLKLQVVATDDVREARTVPAGDVGRTYRVQPQSTARATEVFRRP
jgi:hypothetical protein